ncbi:unnamed protein product [Heterosigma akashiwo]
MISLDPRSYLSHASLWICNLIMLQFARAFSSRGNLNINTITRAGFSSKPNVQYLR